LTQEIKRGKNKDEIKKGMTVLQKKRLVGFGPDVYGNLFAD
jgi:hypothetical protein